MEKVESRPWMVLIQVVGPYLLVIGVTALITSLLFPLRGENNSPAIALLFLLPVSLSTALWGLGPGVAAALLSFLALNYFFIKPYYSLFVHHTQDLLSLAVFLSVAVAISQLVGRTRQSLAVAKAREHEAMRLYELSAVLVGCHEAGAIMQTLAEQAVEAFQADQVDVMLEARAGQPPLLVSQSPRGEPAAGAHRLLAPLESGPALLGEIRLWREDPPFSDADQRLSRAFASQAVLALERARLVRADTRARISEESDRMKTVLLSSVSHELRSPLAVIKAAATSLGSGMVAWDSPAAAELLATIDEETDHLNQLVENLLNMSRIEAGALKPQRSWNILGEIVAGAVRRVRRPQHRIEIHLPDDLPLLPVDYVQMEQVFTNLISNSQKYSPEGTTIHVRAWCEGSDRVHVQVSNQGPPVPAEDLGRIFEKFYRITAADRVTGTGLGLSICKGIIEAHDGRIWAQNLPDGFAFHFVLPLTWQGASPRIPEQ